MIGFGAKLLLTVAGSLGSAIGLTSPLAFKNWDPKHVWRIKTNKNFYLSFCQYRTEDKRGKWVESDLWIYFAIKEPNAGPIGSGTQLKLWGEGYHWRGEDKSITLPKTWLREDLQHTIARSDGQYTQGRFNWITSVDQERNNEKLTRIGEVGGGEDNETFGSFIKCSDKLFQFETPANERKELGLDKFKFTLDSCTENNENKGTQKCSIKVEANSEVLKWQKEFTPIVII